LAWALRYCSLRSEYRIGKHPQASAGPQALAQLQSEIDQKNVRAYSAATLEPRLASYSQKDEEIMTPSPVEAKDVPDSAKKRRIVRTASIQMVVQHPAEVAKKIAQLTEKLGG